MSLPHSESGRLKYKFKRKCNTSDFGLKKTPACNNFEVSIKMERDS